MTKKLKLLLPTLLFMAVWSCQKAPKATPADLLPHYELAFDSLANTWDEGIPLGNGTVGALIWKKEGKLRFSLDRADLWDLRPMANLDFKDYGFDWVKEQWKKDTYKAVQDKYDVPYDQLPAPSKIPGGAMEFNIDALGPVESVKLILDDAVCVVKWKNGTVLETFVHATEPVGWYRFKNLPSELAPMIIPPPYVSDKKSGEESPVTGQDLRRLGYPKGTVDQKGNAITYDQEGWDGFKFQVHTRWEQQGNSLTGSWSISSKQKDTDTTIDATETVNHLNFPLGMDAALESHTAWWHRFWNKSTLRIPEPVLQNQWYMEMYKFGSAARQGAPPISLQSVWTADNGKLPPWKGDFHHDLNTQLSYWPAYSGNHLDLETGFIDWLTAHKDAFKKYTKDFYRTDGLNVPGVTTLTGEPMGGWIQYSFGPTVSAWLGQHFYLHWRYSMDRVFLKNDAYPWISDVARHFDELSVMGTDGKRKLPLSSSPEIHNNARDAWFGETTNYDLALIRFTYEKAAELAKELGYTEEAVRWETALQQWPGYAIDPTGLMFSPTLPYRESHRHFSHLMAVHPLGLIDVSKGPKDREIINHSLANLKKIGSSQWTGYSFSWLGNLEARAQDGEAAAEALTIFATAFCLPNSFHVNGDQSGKGYSDFTYRPFTLEGNFAFASGVQEMLIQSHTGTVQLFPAIPKAWKNVSFDKLRTEGAFLVSAEMKDGKVERVNILTEKGGQLRLQNPFGTKDLIIEGAEAPNWDGDILVLETTPQQEITVKWK
ncbi:glycoside hydrolase family 95 protein [Flavobacteriaceae bacterium F89]|uniref:Glycoside hydrolase family 95 protein n=1 Tax=Cerina litoralis TaxID=2874477 RepID=A0AAE3EYP1_9FLAO|nr:hypothetical protein [Cerina litoralis]MCG2462191.1 glycoside hydrolase family 95 protein [Cerina litoralis]